MTETLTREDLLVLRGLFPAQAHEFRNGFAYIAEEWVTGRIEEVDPAFSFEVTSTYCRDKQAIVVARLTIKGSTRSNTGMQMLDYVKDKATKQPTDTESGEAEKGATTDALKRCARLFGVGRYLLIAPKNLDEKSIGKWLETLHKPSGTPNGNQNGGAHTGTELKITGVKAVKIVKKGDKRWLDAGGVIFWSRDAFRDAGYDTESWTTEGVIQLKEVPFTVVYTLNDKGIKTGVKVVAE